MKEIVGSGFYICSENRSLCPSLVIRQWLLDIIPNLDSSVRKIAEIVGADFDIWSENRSLCPENDVYLILDLIQIQPSPFLSICEEKCRNRRNGFYQFWSENRSLRTGNDVYLISDLI